jgi:hypothetical protein
MEVKHYAYGHSVATLLNPPGVTKFSHSYRLVTVVMDVPFTIHYHANYKIKTYYLR